MPILLLLFIAIPVIEVYLLFTLAGFIGGVNTFLLVIITGVAGASLAKHQGLMVIAAVQKDLAEGTMPTDHILSGLLVLIGAVLLVTPGVLTDLVGLLLMIPGNRRLLTQPLRKYFAARSSISLTAFPGNTNSGPPTMKDADEVRIVDEEES